MIIDSHEHVMFPTELQIEKIDKAEIDKAVLFTTTPHPEKAFSLNEFKSEMSILFKILGGENTLEINKKRMKKDILDLTEVIKKYPDRFYGFGPVPLGMTFENTELWIKKYIIENNLKGVGEFTPGNDEQINQLETVFKVLKKIISEENRILPVWVHTFNPVTLNGIKILEKLTEKYSEIPVIFGHMGGYNWLEVADFVKNTSNAYIDLSGTFSTLAVKMVINEVPEKCLYSSDAPYGEPILNKQMIEYLIPSKKIKNKVFGENILKLLK
jgi:hypothetical protein